MFKHKTKKLKEKPKRKPAKFYNALRLLLILLITALVIIVIVSLSLTNVDHFPSEVITVPFTKVDATRSKHAYAGVVILVIEGTGQAGGNDSSDAFYLYAHGDGTLYDPPWIEHFDLEIDGQRAIYSLDLLDNPPTFNPDHRYAVEYYVGDTRRPITFRISDSIVDDNTGEFRITIYRMSK